MEIIYKEYTKERLEQTMKEHQGIDFLNFINEMLNDGWSLTKIDKAKIMTKKAIRERMKKMNAAYDSSINQYVIQDIQTDDKLDTNEIQKSIINDIIQTQNDNKMDTDKSVNAIKYITNTSHNSHEVDEKQLQSTELNLSANNVELLQSLEAAMKQLTKQMTQLNQNGVKVNGLVGSAMPEPATGSNTGEFVAKRFDKDDQLINRNHRFYESLLQRLNEFHEDHPQYNLQQTINSLLSEILDKYNY